MAVSQLRNMFTSEPLGPPDVVSLVYSSKNDEVRPFRHKGSPSSARITPAWLKKNMGGLRFWDIAVLVEYTSKYDEKLILRADIWNHRQKGNTCTHEDLRELLITEHAALIKEVQEMGYEAEYLYWIATPNAPYISDDETLLILEQVHVE